MESMKANFVLWSMIISTPRQNRELGPAWREERGGENEKIQLKTQKKCSRYE